MAEVWAGITDAIGQVTESFKSIKTSTKTYGGTSVGDSAGSLAAASGGGKGGYFRFPDVATAKKMKQSFEGRRDSILKRETRILSAKQALETQFANDPASMGYSNQAVQSLQSLYDLNRSMHTYADNYVKKLAKAIEAYEKNEDQGSSSFGHGQARA